jgi:hypothetical protein
LKAYLNQKDNEQSESALERYQMLGFGSMRLLHEARQDKAVMKNL